MSSKFDKKRKRPDGPGKKRLPVPKKRMRASQYHSSSEEDSDVAKESDRIIASDSMELQEGSSEDEEDTFVTAKSGIESGRSPVYVALANESDGFDDGFDAADDTPDEDSGHDSDDSDTSSHGPQKRKRNDPSAFATSISKILNSKLTSSKRADPVLSRSKDASIAVKEIAESRLEAKAKHKLKEEKKAERDRVRVKDVLGVDTEGVEAAAVAEQEKKLKRMAQRGVIKLFNAVRAAQVKVEQADREARSAGIVGATRKQEKINEMSKQGFLDLLSGGPVE